MNHLSYRPGHRISGQTRWSTSLLLLILLAVSCTTPAVTGVVTFDLDKVNAQGLQGPPDGLRDLAYEFCIPDTEPHRTEVAAIDPSVQFMGGSRGRIGCGPDQCLCIGSTHQENWKSILQQLAALPYVEQIDECFFE